MHDTSGRGFVNGIGNAHAVVVNYELKFVAEMLNKTLYWPGGIVTQRGDYVFFNLVGHIDKKIYIVNATLTF